MSRRASRPALGRRILGVAASFGTILALAVAAHADAHAILLRTEPLDGAILSGAPAEIRLVFSEAVDPSLSQLTFVAQDGRPIQPTSVRNDPGSPGVLVVGMPVLDRGAYRLSWRAVAADDLHVSAGSLVFGIGVAAPAPRPVESPTAGTLEVGLRWAGLAALAVLIGALLVDCLVLPRARRRIVARVVGLGWLGRGESRVRKLALAAGAAALVTSPALLFVQASAIGGLTGDSLQVMERVLLGTQFGAAWVVGELEILLLIGLTLFRIRAARSAGRARTGRWPTLVLVGTSSVLAASVALAGHGAGETGNGPVLIVAMAVHLLAAAVWSGGLVAVAVVVIPLLRGGAEGRAVTRAIFVAFGWFAAVSVVALAATGLLAAGLLVASPDALFLSRYGQALVVKTALFLAVGVLGLRHAALVGAPIGRFARRLLGIGPGVANDDTGIKPSLIAESIGATAVLLLAAVLASTQPARGPAWDPQTAESAPPPAVTLAAEDLIVTVAVRPDRPGPNFVTVGVFDTRRPTPGPVERVTVSLVAPDGSIGQTADASVVAPGRYEAPGLSIASDGLWTVSVALERNGLATATVRTAWPVLPAQVVRPPAVISDRPLADLTTPLAAILLVTALGLFFHRGLRRDREANRGLPSAGADGRLGASIGGEGR